MIDPLSGLQAGDDVVFLGDAVGGNDERDVAAHRLLGGVAEEPLGGGVPALNDAVERLADDGVVRRFDDRRQQAGRQKLAGLVLLHAPLRGDVAEDQHAAGDLSASSRIGAALSSIGHSLPSFRISTVWFARPTTTPSRSALCRRVLDRLARLLVDDPKHRVERLAQGIRLRPAGQRLGHGIQVGDAALDIGRDDRVADAAQRDPQHLAPLAGPRAGRAASPRRTR